MGEMMYGATTKIGQSMGNTEPGDGFKYRGRGFIQLTGKSNYAAASKAIFGDNRLVENPDLASDPAVAAQISAWFTEKQGKGMAKKMGIDLSSASQEDLNRVYTSAIAGREIKKGEEGYLGGEVMAKVSAYSKQFGGKSTDNSSEPTAVAATIKPEPKSEPTAVAATIKPEPKSESKLEEQIQAPIPVLAKNIPSVDVINKMKSNLESGLESTLASKSNLDTGAVQSKSESTFATKFDNSEIISTLKELVDLHYKSNRILSNIATNI